MRNASDDWFEYIEIPLTSCMQQRLLRESEEIRRRAFLQRAGKRAGSFRQSRIWIHSKRSDEKNRRFVS